MTDYDSHPLSIAIRCVRKCKEQDETGKPDDSGAGIIWPLCRQRSTFERYSCSRSRFPQFRYKSTHAATGVLKAPEHRRSPYLDLRHQSWEEWPQLAEQLMAESGGVDCGFRICGGLDLRDRTVQDPHRALEKLHGSGGNVRVLDQQELKRLLPEMHREPQAGLYIEHQAVVDPGGLMEALRRSCLGLGAEIAHDLGEISLGFEEGRRIVRSSLEASLPPIDEKNPLILSAGWETSALINPALEKPLPLKPVGEAIALTFPLLLTS